MRIVGVIDVRSGRAVHARGGRRDEYAPVGVVAGERVDGDAVALARVYADVLGVRELYLADLDAIERGVVAMNAAIVERAAALGVPIWVDAGASTGNEARRVMGAGASAVVVGLETLPGFAALGEICVAVGGQRVAFSVDLRDGSPITVPNVAHSTWSAVEIAKHAAGAGASAVIVLDLARVGTAAGIDAGLVASVRQVAPDVTLFAGGGVRSEADVDLLASAGCDGALVATALLSGALRLQQDGTSPTGRSSPRPPFRSP